MKKYLVNYASLKIGDKDWNNTNNIRLLKYDIANKTSINRFLTKIDNHKSIKESITDSHVIKLLGEYVISKISQLTETTIPVKRILTEDEIPEYIDKLNYAFYVEYKEELDGISKRLLEPVLEPDSLIYQLKSFYYNSYIVLILTPIEI